MATKKPVTKKRSQSLTIPDAKSESLSEEEYRHEIIEKMHVKFKNVGGDQTITSPKRLEYYNRVYENKRKVDGKNLVFYMTDETLIELSNDHSDIIYLQVVKGSQDLSPRSEDRSRSSSTRNNRSKSPFSDSELDSKTKLDLED